MKPKVLVDFHHNSLLRSLIMLFEDRLDIDVYRPIGMDWFYHGYWGINNNYDTAKQFLSRGQIPSDGTCPLNTVRSNKKGIYYCYDPGGQQTNRACTLDYFKRGTFDYVVASIPAHIPMFKKLIRKYCPHAKLIIQVGNNWGISEYQGENILASIKPFDIQGVNAIFYHQEFDLNIFNVRPHEPTKKIYSFVNVLENMPQAQEDFNELERLLKPYGYQMCSFGGQNRDGNMNGPQELADKMAEADLILHSKPGGDGFGHIIHNAYAMGKPVIIRSSHYRGQLAESLFAQGTFLDIDKLGRNLTAEAIKALDPERLQFMGEAAHRRFTEVVNYEEEAREIKYWLRSLA